MDNLKELKYKKVFIVGSGRSGTHWLRRILQSNKKALVNDYESSVYKIVLGTLTRSRFYWNRSWKIVLKNFKHSHLDKWISEEDFIKMVSDIKKIKGSKELKSKLLITQILDTYYEENKTNFTQILVEKTPGHVHYVENILNDYREAKILEIVRDGRDVCMSLDKLNQNNITWAPLSLGKKISLWKKSIEPCLAAKENPDFKKRIMTVKYEDLQNNFEKAVKLIFDFCEISLTKAEIECMIDKNEFDIITRVSDKNWKNYFDKKTQDLTTKKMKRELSKLNYPLN